MEPIDDVTSKVGRCVNHLSVKVNPNGLGIGLSGTGFGTASGSLGGAGFGTTSGFLVEGKTAFDSAVVSRAL
jgi:hypothetical protein